MMIAALRTGESASGATGAEVLISHAAAFIPQQVASAASQKPPAQAWRSLADLGGSAASLHPARDILQLASKMLPRQGEVQSSGADAVALDDDVEVGLPVRGGLGIEQHSAG